MRQYNMKIVQIRVFNRGWHKYPSPGSNPKFKKTKSQIFPNSFSVQNEHEGIRINHVILSDLQIFQRILSTLNAKRFASISQPKKFYQIIEQNTHF